MILLYKQTPCSELKLINKWFLVFIHLTSLLPSPWKWVSTCIYNLSSQYYPLFTELLNSYIFYSFYYRIESEEAASFAIAQFILGGPAGIKHGSASTSKIASILASAGGTGNIAAINASYTDGGLFGFLLVNEQPDKAGNVSCTLFVWKFSNFYLFLICISYI